MRGGVEERVIASFRPLFVRTPMLRRISPSTHSRVMEESLDIPLRDVLKIIQKQTFKSTWFGVSAVKSPLDFWTYQEIIFAVKPRIIVDIGTNIGGTTLALAHLLDLLGQGRVITIDVDHSRVDPTVREHPRISFVNGDACELLKDVSKAVGGDGPVLIIEDSSHTYENTLNVLRCYSALVTKGSYFIVEDGICHHGLNEGPKPGPYEAVNQFLAENHDFEADRSKEPYLITWNPNGYLKRLR